MTATTETTPVQPPTPPPPPKKSGVGVLTKLIIVLLSVAVGAVAVAIGWVLWTDSKIERIPGEELPGLAAPLDGPRTILIVGTDDRSDIPDEFDNTFGDFGGSRTDVIMLAQIEPGEGIRLLSLPRDLRVDIPGEGIDKINSAFVSGGPQLLIQTINDNYNIAINHYAEIDLGGFARLVDSLGGVTMVFEHPARDAKSGLDVAAGVQELDGEQALAYVRSRKYQEQRNGEWVSVGATDIGRTERQQELLLAVFDEATSRSNAFDLPGFASQVAEEVVVDSGLTLGVIIDLGQAALGMDRSDIDAATLPVDIYNENGKSYVIPTAEADTVLVAFRAGQRLPS